MSYLWIFAVFDAGVLAMVVAELGGSGHLSRARPRTFSPSLAVVLLVCTYIAQLVLVGYAVSTQVGQPKLPSQPPVGALGNAFAHSDAVDAAMIALGAGQSLLLLLLYRGRPSTALIVTGSLVLTVLSMAWPVMFSTDVYAYIGYGLLGRGAYDPSAVPFTGDLATLTTLWGAPMPPCPYGPLMIAAAAAAGAPFSTLIGKFYAMRALDAASFGALVWLLHAIGLPRRVVAVAALNPGLLFAYVESAHNDLFGIVLVLAGGALLPLRPFWAGVAMTAGGLVKLPFAFFALPLLAAARTAKQRLLLAVAVPFAATAMTWIAGGSGVVRAASRHVASSGVALVLTAAVAVAGSIAIVAAAMRKRRLLSIVWAIPLMTAYALPWYLVWSLPYAAGRRRIAGYLLVAFPLAGMLLDVKLMKPWTLTGVVPFVFAIAVLEMRRTRRRPVGSQ